METVDVRRVFREKNPSLARLIPGFIFRYLERIIHQDYANWFFEKYKDQYGLDWAHAAIKDFNISLNIKGEENLPADGRFIFASNHPLGGFDGLLLLSAVRRHYPRAIFLANDILMNLKNMEDLFIPINKHGSQSRDSVRMIEKMYQSDTQLLTFPSGYVSRRIKRVIQDLEWQKSFIAKAIQHRRDIIPVHISGRNTNFFYRLGTIRKFLRIKANLEMFYLVDETYKHRNKTIEISFGKPLPYSSFDKSRTHKQWAVHVREIAYSLPVMQETSATNEK